MYSQRETPARSWLRITCDGAAVAELKQGFFFALALPPGRHMLGLESGVPAFVDLRAGEDAFVRLDWNHGVGRAPIPVLKVVRPDRAHAETRFLSYIAAKRALSATVSKSDPRDAAPTQLQRRTGK